MHELGDVDYDSIVNLVNIVNYQVNVANYLINIGNYLVNAINYIWLPLAGQGCRRDQCQYLLNIVSKYLAKVANYPVNIVNYLVHT